MSSPYLTVREVIQQIQDQGVDLDSATNAYLIKFPRGGSFITVEFDIEPEDEEFEL